VPPTGSSDKSLGGGYGRWVIDLERGWLWGNWVIRVRATGAAARTVQATLPTAGPASGPAEVAWVVARAAQGQGYASEAARSLVFMLRQAGWTVAAHIHPRHHASQRVARAAGLMPTTDIRDGEIRWVSPPPAAP
jgi:RimJ/RimL family protein N-acetyltransferase